MNDSVRIHATAIVEQDVRIGDRTSIWDSVHIRRGASIGADCIVGEKTYIAYDVVVGKLCKINANVYLCAGVTLHDGVMVAAHTVFTNDLLPRASDPEIRALRASDPDAATLATTVGRGATIGANCTIGPGVTLGEFCMIGMGSVVTRNVPKHALMVGNPARVVGLVCACGKVVARVGEDGAITPTTGTQRSGTYLCGCGRDVASAYAG